MAVFIIPTLLIALGLLAVYLLVDGDSNDNDIGVSIFSTYFVFLIVGSVVPFIASVYWWLIDATWISLSPLWLADKLNENNFLREILLSDTSWKGVKELNNMYLHASIGWSFIVALIFFIVFYIVALKEKYTA